MKSAAIVLTGLLALLAPAAALAQGPAREPDVSDLQRQLQEMRSQVNRMQSRIEELERAQANSGTNHRAQLAAHDQPGAPQCPTCPPVKPADSPNPPSRPAGALGSAPWVFTLGGYIKLDMIHDFNAIGSTDSFNPRTIPVDGSPGADTRFHARETRLSLGIVGPIGGRDLKLLVEGDFYGTANGVRLRHAYGEYGPLLAGQTWTTFMDEANIPHTIDFETPLAAPLVRQGLLRLTARPSKRTQLALGIEESDPEVLPPPGVAGKTEKTLPDFTGRFRFTNGRGHVQLSGFVGQTRFRPDKGEPTDVTIYGGLASARFRTLLRDVAYAQFSYGPGLGRYRGDLSAAPDAAGQLKAVKAMALTLGYEHYWAARWSSNFVASPAWVLSDLGDPATFNRRLDYVAANLRYWFLEERAWLGGEYLYGLREVRSRDRGSANRLQLAVRFNIP
jgi:hypothetical protein